MGESNLKKIAVLVAIGILLFFTNYIGVANYIRNFTSVVFSPVLFVSGKISGGINGIFDSIDDLNNLQDDYNKLLEKSTQMESQNALVQLLIDENSKLKSQLALGDKKWKLVESKVLVGGESESPDYLIIDKGSNDGIKVGNIALIGNIYVGTIVDVGPNSSKVRLPVSSASYIQVLIYSSKVDAKSVEELQKTFSNGTYTSGIASGSLSGILIDHVDNNSVVNVGDSIIINDKKVGDYLYLGSVEKIVDNPAAASKSLQMTIPINYNELKHVFIRLDK